MDPVTEWRRVQANDADVEDAQQVVSLLAEAGEYALPSALAGAVDSVVYVLASSGTDPAPLLAPLAAAQARAHASAGADSPADGLGVVGAATLRAAAGATDDDPGPLLAARIPAVIAAGARLTDRDRTEYALACCAQRYDETVGTLLPGRPVDYVPGQTFGPDVPSFIRYLVASAAAGAILPAVNPAWTSFVGHVPTLVATRSLRWTSLLYAGYAVYTRFAGTPPAEVLGTVRELVSQVVES